MSMSKMAAQGRALTGSTNQQSITGKSEGTHENT